MISTEAKNKLEKLKNNYQENFEYVMKTPIDKQQKDWEESALHYQQPDFMKKKEFCLAGLTGEVFSWKDSLEENADKIIVHFHGGGLTLGSAITHRKLGTLIDHLLLNLIKSLYKTLYHVSIALLKIGCVYRFETNTTQ